MSCNLTVEYNHEIISISLTPDEFERATQDSMFLKQVVDQWILTHRAVSKNTESSTGENETQLIWSAENVKLLLAKYKSYEEEFSAGTKRHKSIWTTIAVEIDRTANFKVTATQYQTKLNGLKRTYKNIKDHNKKSGNNRVSWPFFEEMDEIFGKKGWVEPVALASEQGSFQCVSSNNSDPSTSHSQPGCSKDCRSTNMKKSKNKQTLQNLLDLKERYYTNKEKKREEMFRQLLELRKKQHKEKMELLKSLINNNSSS